MSGGRILWNAVAICEMTKTSWQTENLKIWGEDILIAEIEELIKLDSSENFPGRLTAKEVLITQKDGEFVFPVADGSAKLSGRDHEFQEPTLRRESTVREENLSGELTTIGKSFDLKNKKMTQKIGNNFGLFKDTSFIVIISNWEFNWRAENHSLFNKIYTIERNSSEKKYTMREEDCRKAKTSEATTNSIMLILQGKDGILYFITTLRTNSFRW